jgi:predicted small lipoprotein YifL
MAAISGVHRVSLFCDRPFLRLALVGVAIASLTLAGCGRKGPLDPPPGASAAVTEQQAGAVPAGASEPLVAPIGQTRENAASAPRATPTSTKRIFLDNLLN